MTENMQAASKPVSPMLFSASAVRLTKALMRDPDVLVARMGLEGTHFYRQGPIKTIVDELVPQLVGKDSAAQFLPGDYKGWVAR